MSNKQNSNQQPQRPTSQQAITEAERVLETLRVERRRLAAKAADLSSATARLSYSTHALHDAASTEKLNEVRADTQIVATQMREHDHAIVEAEQRLAQVRRAEAREVDKAQAKALRKAVAEFVDAGMHVDRVLAALAEHGHALQQALDKVHRSGSQFPTQQQLDSLGHLCLRSAIMQTPWARSVETVPPGQRRSFRSLIEAWAANIESNHVAPRLGEGQTNTEAA